MINKKNYLVQKPTEAGIKDAVHCAIVSVRAGATIQPGQRCKINEFGEAIPGNGPGFANVFMTNQVLTGEFLWLMMHPNEVESVLHTWEHKDDFIPKRDIAYNNTLLEYAEAYGVTYQQLMDALTYKVHKDKEMTYLGTKTEEEITRFEDNVYDYDKNKIYYERYDLWSEWGMETNYTFPNWGTECCPEWRFPDAPLFIFKEN